MARTLRGYRADKGATQAEVAAAIGVSIPTYIELEKNPAKFADASYKTVIAATRYFGMPPAELFACSGTPENVKE